MDKRYQVFVSSTYADLQQERQKVIQTLMEMDCIPAGMEIFPAADEEQWEFIKKVINDCDYYLLIVGGRYGSLTAKGISYTEQEYDYAVGNGLKVLAFLHEKPDEIPIGKSDIDSALRMKLAEFRNKASSGRLVRFWNHAAELPGLVALSLSKTIKTYPAIGWIRGSNVANDELLGDINSLRKENDTLRARVMELDSKPTQLDVNLAPLDGTTNISVEWNVYYNGSYVDRAKTVAISWEEIFAGIAPDLIEHPNDLLVNRRMAGFLSRKYSMDTTDKAKVAHDDFQTVKIQLKALGLVDVSYLKTTGKDMALFWSLTQKGYALMMQLRTVKPTGALKT